MTRNRYKVFENEYPYLVTCTVINWLDLLKPDTVKQIIINSIQFLKDEQAIKIFAYVIMHNHLHLILSSENLPVNICRFKSHTAKKIIKYYKSNQNLVTRKLTVLKPKDDQNSKHQFWQEGYCPKQIMSHDILQQKIDYIQCNPVRKGYVDSPEKWKWSSARNFANLDSVIEIDPIVD
jgi:putative transposase